MLLPLLLFWVAALLLVVPVARAADLPGPWVELVNDGGLDVRSIIAPGMPCPKVLADGKELASQVRGKSDDDFPIEVCVAHASASVGSLTVNGLPAPILPANIKRIVVIGDTGCGLKRTVSQSCNDPVRWPFATVARLAASRHPDLIIHLGDYHYREFECPADEAGCAGSPWGDNWPAWQKDFFDPAAPLLAVAPWVLVRGNHESCDRGGHGWFRLLDPHPATETCLDTTDPYLLRMGPLNLLLFDGSQADEHKVDPALSALYQAQLKPLLATAPPHTWLLTHRPVWALAQGPDAKPGETLTAIEQAALRDLPLQQVDMVLSGHIHNFTSYEFGPSHPAQLVVGESGDINDAITQPLTPGTPIGDAKIRRAWGIPDYGYVVLHRVTQGWTGVVYSLTDKVLARCRLHGRGVSCRPAVH